MSNVPKLRFSEFSGEWEEKKLENYGKLINGLTYSPDNIVENGLLVLRSSNIQNQQISFHDNVYVDLDIKEEYLTKENDILICVRNGSKRLIGKSLLIQNNLPKATHGAFMTVFRGESNKFISHWFKTPIFFKEVYKNLGATINSINGSDLKKFKTIFPLKQEQEKIASFLTSVDTKIEQLTKKELLLQEYKKGVMQKIFNQEIRFKDEDESEFSDWEEKKLGDVCKKIQDGNYGASYPKSEEFISKGIPFLTSKAIQNGILVKEKIDYISIEKHQELKKAHLKLYDILFTNRGSNVGNIGFVDESISNGNIGPQLTLLRTDNTKLLPIFLFQTMTAYYFQKQINSQDSGSAMNFFGIGDTSKFKIKIPSSIIEQTKIANFLSSIDKKIENVRNELEKTKEFKKALLQQMFV